MANKKIGTLGPASEALLAKIRTLAGPYVDPWQLDAVVDEVRAHLDASIQSQLDRFECLADAEREAIKSFGNPSEFVRTVIATRGKTRGLWFDRKVWRSLIVCVVLLSVISACADLTYWHMGIPLAAVALVCGIWIAVTSWRAPRPQILPLLAAGILGTLIVAVLLSIEKLAPTDFSMSGGFRPDVVRRLLSEDEVALRKQVEVESSFALATNRYYRNLSKGSPLMKPVWRTAVDGHLPGRYEMKLAASQSDYQRAWRLALARSSNQVEIQRRSLELDAATLREMLERPFLLNVVYQLPFGSFIGLVFLIAMSYVSLGAWVSYQTTRLINRRLSNA